MECESSLPFPVALWPVWSCQFPHDLILSVCTCGMFSRCLYLVIDLVTFFSFGTCTAPDCYRRYGAVILILFLPLVNHEPYFTNMYNPSIQRIFWWPWFNGIVNPRDFSDEWEKYSLKWFVTVQLTLTFLIPISNDVQ